MKKRERKPRILWSEREVGWKNLRREGTAVVRDWTPDEIREALGRLLPFVEAPARYLGGEGNTVLKEFPACEGTIAFLFPDNYEVGMSNNGVRVLYHVVNRRPKLLMEVAFLPMPDMAERMIREGMPLYTHGSFRPIRDFDLVGITVQSELNYTNIPFALDLAGIPVCSSERGDDDPFVAGGGPCSANCEPVADFFDFFSIGDGETVLPDLVELVGRMRREGKSRVEILEAASKIDGVYVPALTPTTTNEWGEIVPLRPATGSYERTEGVRRAFIRKMDPEFHPVRNLVPNTAPVHPRFALEVMRGCTQGCRFCQAGYWYRPVREFDADVALRLAREGIEATGEHELGLLSLSTADYSQLEPLLDKLIDDPFFHAVDVSVPSLRVNSYGKSVAYKVQALKAGRSATFAPETGSQRLRRMINKTISDDDIYQAAEAAFSTGYNKVKLYSMIGFPTEGPEDMEACGELIENIRKIGYAHDHGNQVHASVGILVPKPFTPMQWVGFVDKERALSNLALLRGRFRDSRTVRISWTSWEQARLESFYSRGDRSLAPMILEASRRGLVFESQGERIDFAGWESIWAEFGYDMKRIHGDRPLDMRLPWDGIHAGVSVGYLKSEYEKMFRDDAEPVNNCKWGDCHKCGIPGFGRDTVLAKPPESPAPSRTEAEIAELQAARRSNTIFGHPTRLLFSKVGLSRFLPHQTTMDLLARAISGSGVRLEKSHGFNPRPIVKNAGALPLGAEAIREELVVRPLDPMPEFGSAEGRALLEKINAKLPDGLSLAEWTAIEKSDLSVCEKVRWRFDGASPADLAERLEAGEFGAIVDSRGKEIDLRAEILELERDEARLDVVLKANAQGNAVSPYPVFGALLGVDPAQVRTLRLRKIGN
ncbi:MAG: TIGR03960 family B12-binding radical SAM protein [Fibrobacterales bacterium]|nr:TIGR03960 family B12-binding radical SAM protein [Fibrobacterales bacterium]